MSAERSELISKLQRVTMANGATEAESAAAAAKVRQLQVRHAVVGKTLAGPTEVGPTVVCPKCRRRFDAAEWRLMGQRCGICADRAAKPRARSSPRRRVLKSRT